MTDTAQPRNDQVNTASRMESSGAPMRTQLSETTARALLAAGGWMVELRGDIKIKGKGIMRTYWLDGIIKD